MSENFPCLFLLLWYLLRRCLSRPHLRLKISRCVGQYDRNWRNRAHFSQLRFGFTIAGEPISPLNWIGPEKRRSTPRCIQAMSSVPDYEWPT
jgi:hypothetical protein